MRYTKDEETTMIKQLSTGQVVNVSNLENMHDLFTNEQFEIIEAYLEYQEEQKSEIIDELEEVNNILNEKETAVNNLLKYVKRYGFKNESKVLEKIENI